MEKRTLIMKKKSIAIGLNALLVIMGIAGFVLTVRDIGFFDFQYYTQDSNLLSLMYAFLYERLFSLHHAFYYIIW